ncbi:MAG: glycosyltransferase family 4 protein [Pseudorhodoplanes sp.]
MTDLDAIIPNLHWNYTGVTATNRMIAPQLSRLASMRWFGPDAPDGVETMRLSELLMLPFRSRRKVIWHARRNNEMMAGLLLKWLGWPFRLVFTSAAQRHHTWITRFLIARMDAVIAASDAAAAYLMVPCEVILHGVDTARYRPPKSREAEFQISGLPGKYAIGCFGRVRHQKGTDVFIEAVSRVLPHYPDFSAVVVGAVDDAAFEAGLKARVAEAGIADRVRFLGERPIDEVPLWYRRILIYAFTSRNEGFGLTLLEAMASGNALVAARAGAAEAVVTGGQVAYLVPAGDPSALASALEQLMRDPERATAMGQRARDYVAAHFSIEAEAQKIAAAYERVLGRKTLPPSAEASQVMP